ncbi:MAG: tRNA (adenosine(37)-N6)-dimethylallyltransferase MiaA [Lentisphaerae bacterium GWF2_52_8]|nr:MAG: tRNA (adenosine(37)-N6)-dimethylallyltransferase MiaA [Lentisphaerae bacterium GWF2_52_8]
MGPTASGKSSLALDLAKRLGGEIVSADSMQAYRGLDIGTAKPNQEERSAIPHHLIDIMDISEPLDVFRYVSLAETAINEISSRGRLPVIVGGSGLYIRSLLYGLDPLPAQPALRANLEEQYGKPETFEALKKLMAEKDPADFARWQKDQRKLLRALEVFSLTGKPITELQTIASPKLRYPLLAAWRLEWPREELKERIRLRTEQMLGVGWIEEARQALSRGLAKAPSAWQALGYGIIGEFLDGKISREKMCELISTATWQFARRQITWFSHKHPEAETILMPADLDALQEKLSRKAPALPEH